MLFRTEHEPDQDAVYKESPQMQNGDLGYYPDGAKRTLTDDQVAMFRHSEIYSVLRERQVRMENLEAEGGDQSEAMLSQPEGAAEATALSDTEGEVQSDEKVKEAFAATTRSTPHSVDFVSAGKKRKRGNTEIGYSYGKKHASRSTRGIVRELDSAAVEDQTLDYGDKPSFTEESIPNEFEATQDAEQDCESRARPAEGKKIWWPVIGAN